MLEIEPGGPREDRQVLLFTDLPLHPQISTFTDGFENISKYLIIFRIVIHHEEYGIKLGTKGNLCQSFK